YAIRGPHVRQLPRRGDNMRKPMRAHRLPVVLLACCTLFTVTLGASAKDTAYVGTWGKDKARCKVGQEMEDAPMIVKARRYDQQEPHCEFKPVRQEGSEWRIKAQCSVEGDRQYIDFTFSVANGRLTVKQGNSKQDYVRCR